MLKLLKADQTDRPRKSGGATIVNAGASDRVEPAPSQIDWSNIVFSVAFCEKAKRDYEARMGGRLAV